MKFKNRNSNQAFSLLDILVIIAILAMLAVYVFTAHAQNSSGSATLTPQQPNFVTPEKTLFGGSGVLHLTNSSVTAVAGSTNSYVKTLRPGKGLALFLQVYQTNVVSSATTSTNFVLKFDVTDGTLWTRSQPIVWTIPCLGLAGAATNGFYTNIPAQYLDNARAIQCTSASTTASNDIAATLDFSLNAN